MWPVADRFLDLRDEDKRDLFVGLQDKMKLSPIAIEKDIWVCWVLQTLFSMPGRPRMCFKGGTSLSKVFGVISRFSEDIDVTINHRTENAPELDPFKEGTSKTEIKRIAEEFSKLTVKMVRESIVPYIRRKIEKEFGGDGFWFDIDQTGEKLTLGYPSVFDLSDRSRYMSSSVLVEFGGKNSIDPQTSIKVRTEISLFLPAIELPEAQVDVLDPKRTFWGNVLNYVHIWSLPRLQEVFPVLRTIAAVIYPASEWKVIGLPGLDEVPRTSSLSKRRLHKEPLHITGSGSAGPTGPSSGDVPSTHSGGGSLYAVPFVRVLPIILSFPFV